MDMPGLDFLAVEMEKARQAFLIEVRKTKGSPLTEGEFVTAKLAFAKGYMGGAQSGAYLLYAHHVNRGEPIEKPS